MSHHDSESEQDRPPKQLFRFGILNDAPKSADRRQHTRYACSFPVTLRFGTGEQEQVLQGMARDVSIGGMLIEGANVPDGVIRLHVQFEIPPDVLKDEKIPRKIQTSAEIRCRDTVHKTLSLDFSEPLRPPPAFRLSGDRWIMLFTMAMLMLLVPCF